MGGGALSEEWGTSAAPSTDRPILFEVEDLRVRFELESGPIDVLKGVSFRLHQGEILCVVGESGSGKTVMTHALMGLVSVNPGVIGATFGCILGANPWTS